MYHSAITDYFIYPIDVYKHLKQVKKEGFLTLFCFNTYPIQLSGLGPWIS